MLVTTKPTRGLRPFPTVGILLAMNRTARLCVLFVCILLPLAAADWPQWRGPERDGISKEADLLTEWPAGGPPLVWKVTGLGDGYASVAVAAGRDIKRRCTNVMLPNAGSWRYGQGDSRSELCGGCAVGRRLSYQIHVNGNHDGNGARCNYVERPRRKHLNPLASTHKAYCPSSADECQGAACR